MIFYLNKKKIIFVHVPKTAGTSILGSLLDSPNIKIKGHKIASLYSEKDFENSFFFSVTRNPYDRFISHWLYHTTNYNGNKFIKKNIDIKNKSLKEYYKISQSMSQYSNNWQSITKFLSNNFKKIDFLIRFENIDQDWLELCDKLKIKKTLLALKQTQHKHYNYYYDNETKKLIENLYSEDFDNFEYPR
jgi:hypothetical protein